MDAQLNAISAPYVLAEIRRLYRQLLQLPHPQPTRHQRRTPEYLALEAAIRALALKYRAWDETRPSEKCRMAKAGFRRTG